MPRAIEKREEMNYNALMKYDMRLMAERVSHLLRLTDRVDNPAEMEDDGVGLNQPDAIFFRDLYISESNINVVAWKLKKYREQLKAADLWGPDLESVKQPSVDEAKGIVRITGQFIKDNKIFFKFKTEYGSDTFKSTIDFIKSIGGRWDGSSWAITANAAFANKEKLEFWGLDLSKLKESAVVQAEVAKMFFMHLEGNTLVIKHDFDTALNETYKVQGGFRWEPKDKTRRFIINEGNASKAWIISEALMSGGYLPGDDVTKGTILYIKSKYTEAQELKKAKTDFSVKIPELDNLLKLPLSPYQLAGVNFIDKSRGRCIIGDEMGLGKTAQAMAWAALRNKRALVVCPKRVKVSWEDDIQKFTDKSFQIINHKDDKFENAFFTIVHYNIVWKIDFSKLNFDLLIIDESHKIKDAKAKQSQGCAAASRLVDHVLPLSGTPVVNRPIELLNQIKVCRPDFIKDTTYLYRFCDPKTIYISGGKQATDFSGASNLTELFEVLSTIYLRREKKDVLTELPDKIHQDIKFDIEFPEIEESESVVGMYSRVKKTIAEAKAPTTAEFVEDTLETGVSLILFTSHPNALQYFKKHFAEKNIPYLVIEAGMTSEESSYAVREFQNNDKYKLIIVSLEVGAEGINLFKASHVVFNDLHWTPGRNQQAEDRAHRRGQKNVVNIYRMIAMEDDPKIFREKDGKLVPVFFDMYLTEIIREKSQIQAIINKGKPVPAEQLRYLEMSLDDIAKRDKLRFK
jgi:SWI/SNF-related matrix-associated actin-dependent regulator 1 of chromatin subfamily A